MNLETPDEYGKTAAFIAARAGHAEVVRPLAERCDLWTLDPYGATPVWVAANEGHAEVAGVC